MTRTLRIPTRLGELAVDRRPGVGPPLVLLHGLFMDRTLWNAQVAALEGRDVATVDGPAHGESSDVGRAWSLSECVGALEELFDALELPNAVLAGHSWGGMVALRFASQSPERVLALGLFNTPLRPLDRGAKWAFRLQRPFFGLKRFFARQATASLYAPESLARHPEWTRHMEESLGERSSRELWRAVVAVLLEPEAATGLVEGLALPHVVAAGEADYVLPDPLARELREGGAEVRIFPGGHVSPREAPEETARALRDLLARAR